MEDTHEFYQGVLGIEDPWRVSGVERDEEAGKIIVKLKFDRGLAGELGGHLHGYVEREWRHLDTCQYQTFIRARVPRLKFPDGSTKEVEVPWADRFARTTRLMEERAIQVLLESRSHRSAARLLAMGEGQLDRIMERAVERGMARREQERIPHVGIDEKSTRRGHHYVSVLTDITRGVVIDLVEGRDREAASSLWKYLSASQRDSIEAVAMDMWPAYMKSATLWVPDADVVHDRFHVAKHLGESVDAIRKAENRALMKQGDHTLKGTKYHWLRRFDDLRSAPASFREISNSVLKTAKAWAYKQTFDSFWAYISEPWARKFFGQWYRSVIHTKLEPIKKVARMLKKHLCGLLAYIKHRITNATAEGINSKIQMLKSNARGLPNFRTLRIRVLFHCGGLQLSPHTI